MIASGGAFGFAAALATFGLAPSFPVLVTASFALGMASTAMVDAAEVALVDVAGDEVSAQISRSSLAGAVGDLLGPALLVTVAASGASWRVAFLAGAMITASYGCWLAASPLPPPPDRRDGERTGDGVRIVLRDRRVRYLGALAMLLGPLDEDFLAFLIAYLERGRNLSPALATTAATASVVGMLVGFASTSRAGYRESRSTLRDHAAATAVAAVVAAAVPSVPVVATAVFVFGFAVARSWIALKTRIVATHPGRVGAVHAVVSTIEFGGFVLPLLAGALADAFGVRAGFAFSAAIAVVMFLVVLAGGRQASSERAI
ncbi:MAG: hypothetical protein KatS3mg009_2768 [Acidimicrobiia bacterium]|nr:MAG: hypothetical protein KatS3mg009_2768 [Acidimicrobiia bacterium]